MLYMEKTAINARLAEGLIGAAGGAAIGGGIGAISKKEKYEQVKVL